MMGASAGEDWDSFIDRMCSLEIRNAELLQKVQQLDEENKKLKKEISSLTDNIYYDVHAH